MRISNSVKRNFGFAGRKFVDQLYQPGVADQVSERYRELFRILSDRDTTEKQAMAAASIILADELACQWIFSGTQQPLTIEQISEFWHPKRRCPPVTGAINIYATGSRRTPEQAVWPV